MRPKKKAGGGNPPATTNNPTAFYETGSSAASGNRPLPDKGITRDLSRQILDGYFDKMVECAAESVKKADRQADDGVDDCGNLINSPRDYIHNYDVFTFCQFLRNVIAPTEAKALQLEPLLRRWYDQCRDSLWDEEGYLLPYSEARSQFLAIWDGNKVKWPKGDLLATAEARARALPWPHPEFLRYDSPRIRLLGNTLAELAILRGDGMVFINQKDAGRIMGRSERIGREVLLMFCADGILEHTKVGHTGLASEYRYVGNEMPF